MISLKLENEFLVSKETVVLRRWERSKQKCGFIKRVDKTKFLKLEKCAVGTIHENDILHLPVRFGCCVQSFFAAKLLSCKMKIVVVNGFERQCITAAVKLALR